MTHISKSMPCRYPHTIWRFQTLWILFISLKFSPWYLQQWLSFSKSLSQHNISFHFTTSPNAISFRVALLTYAVTTCLFLSLTTHFNSQALQSSACRLHLLSILSFLHNVFLFVIIVTTQVKKKYVFFLKLLLIKTCLISRRSYYSQISIYIYFIWVGYSFYCIIFNKS